MIALWMLYFVAVIGFLVWLPFLIIGWVLYTLAWFPRWVIRRDAGSAAKLAAAFNPLHLWARWLARLST